MEIGEDLIKMLDEHIVKEDGMSWEDVLKEHGDLLDDHIKKYSFMADCYKLLMEQGKIDNDTAESIIRIYEFLATCPAYEIEIAIASANVFLSADFDWLLDEAFERFITYVKTIVSLFVGQERD